MKKQIYEIEVDCINRTSQPRVDGEGNSILDENNNPVYDYFPVKKKEKGETVYEYEDFPK